MTIFDPFIEIFFEHPSLKGQIGRYPDDSLFIVIGKCLIPNMDPLSTDDIVAKKRIDLIEKNDVYGKWGKNMTQLDVQASIKFKHIFRPALEEESDIEVGKAVRFEFFAGEKLLSLLLLRAEQISQ
jgi:hypothetical protein